MAQIFLREILSESLIEIVLMTYAVCSTENFRVKAIMVRVDDGGTTARGRLERGKVLVEKSQWTRFCLSCRRVGRGERVFFGTAQGELNDSDDEQSRNVRGRRQLFQNRVSRQSPSDDQVVGVARGALEGSWREA